MENGITRKVNEQGEREYSCNGRKIYANQDELIDIMDLAFAHFEQLFRVAIEVSDSDPIGDIGLCLVELWQKKVGDAAKFILHNHGRIILDRSASYELGHVEKEDIVGLHFIPVSEFAGAGQTKIERMLSVLDNETVDCILNASERGVNIGQALSV